MCALFLVICTLIYMLYFTIFIWYDIFYFCCEPLDYHKVICTGDRKESIPDDSDYWTSDKAKLFTEEYWCKNYPKLFKCTKCNHSAESFKDFLDYKQISRILLMMIKLMLMLQWKELMLSNQIQKILNGIL